MNSKEKNVLHEEENKQAVQKFGHKKMIPTDFSPDLT